MRSAPPILFVAVLLAATSCSSNSTGTIGPADASDAAEEEAASTAPLAFEPEPLVTIVSETEYVHDGTFYGLYLDYEVSRIMRFDMATGEALGEAEPTFEADVGPYVYGDIYAFGGAEGQVVLFDLYEHYSDKFDETATLRLAALDAEDGSVVYSHDLDVKDTQTGSHGNTIDLVANDGEHLMVTVSGSTRGDNSFLFDAATGDLLWSRTGFAAVSFHSGAVAGFDTSAIEDKSDAETGACETEFQVISIADDSVMWSRPSGDYDDVSARSLGDGLVLLTDNIADPALPDAPMYAVVVVDTEAANAVIELEAQDWPRCRYDQVAVFACNGVEEGGTAAWSTTDGSLLWTEPELDLGEEGLPGEFGGEYDGVLYMEYFTDILDDDIPPVAVDAATGEILAEGTPEDIAEVGDGYCITVTETRDRTVSLYRAA